MSRVLAPAGGFHEVGEAAAEAAAGHLIAGDAQGAGVVGVHQVVALVVEDGGHAQAALLEEARGGEDEGGLASAQKTADYRDDGLHSASS